MAPFIGISRHRMATDGKGVTTLAAFYGCPLNCAYCLNPHCKSKDTSPKYYSPQTLYNEVRIDELYFLATSGGITFGGGEPALYSSFIATFREFCGPNWNINLETSFNVPLKNIQELYPVINHYIIDIKDINNDIYHKYTGITNEKTIENLRWLVNQGAVDKITVRIPRIPEYNTEEDIQKSVDFIQQLGITDLDVFEYTRKLEKREKRD